MFEWDDMYGDEHCHEHEQWDDHAVGDGTVYEQAERAGRMFETA
jgi:hypothetical protein